MWKWPRPLVLSIVLHACLAMLLVQTPVSIVPVPGPPVRWVERPMNPLRPPSKSGNKAPSKSPRKSRKAAPSPKPPPPQEGGTLPPARFGEPDSGLGPADSEASDGGAGTPAAEEGGDPLDRMGGPLGRYATFWQRVQRAVVQQWRPHAVINQHDPNLYEFTRTRITVLRIVCDENGDILEVVVQVESGLDWLDAEHQRAVWAVVGFPNPPRGLIRNGRLVFTFTFRVLDRWTTEVTI